MQKDGVSLFTFPRCTSLTARGVGNLTLVPRACPFNNAAREPALGLQWENAVTTHTHCNWPCSLVSASDTTSHPQQGSARVPRLSLPAYASRLPGSPRACELSSAPPADASRSANESPSHIIYVFFKWNFFLLDLGVNGTTCKPSKRGISVSCSILELPGISPIVFLRACHSGADPRARG